MPQFAGLEVFSAILKTGRVPAFSDLPEEFTTFDGLPVSREPPYGATVVVRSESPDGWRFLILHRAHNGADFEGDWAWTPPAGARFPGEGVEACAARELLEESGLVGPVTPLLVEETDPSVFELVVPWAPPVSVDGVEHDRYEWVSLDNACRRCRPAVVAESLRLCVAGDAPRPATERPW